MYGIQGVDIRSGIEDQTFSLDSAMRRWVQAGAPPQKLVAGLAFFGRGFAGVNGATPGRTFSSVPWGTTEAGQFDYAHLVDGVLETMQVSYDAIARVPYAYDASTGVWISYDDPASIEEKGRYVERNGYLGVMVWELSNDADGQLLDAAHRGLDG